MWLRRGEFNVTEIPTSYIAFVYLIHNTTNNKYYIGKKQFFAKRNKKKCESDWKTYTGSSDALNADIADGHQIVKTMLHLCKSKGEASYLEIKEQIDREVLFNDQYYNRFIGCKIHANHVKQLNLS